MTDMPVIPVVFNYNATVTSKILKNVDSTYYVAATFEDAKVSSGSYNKYLNTGKAFVEANFEYLAFQDSKNCSFKDEYNAEKKWSAFTAATTVYSHFVASLRQQK